MKMKLKIIRVRDGSFTGDAGEPISYYWVKGETVDGVTIEFGTKVADHKAGDEKEYDIEKTEKAGGTFRYKEIVEA